MEIGVVAWAEPVIAIASAMTPEASPAAVVCLTFRLNFISIHPTRQTPPWPQDPAVGLGRFHQVLTTARTSAPPVLGMGARNSA